MGRMHKTGKARSSISNPEQEIKRDTRCVESDGSMEPLEPEQCSSSGDGTNQNNHHRIIPHSLLPRALCCSLHPSFSSQEVKMNRRDTPKLFSR